MKHPFPRHVRIARMVQEVIAPALQRLLPNALITVVHVEVSKDLSSAKIRYALIGASAAVATEKLDEKMSELRTKLAKSMPTKRIPDLIFEPIDNKQDDLKCMAL